MRPTIAEIDLTALGYNLSLIRKAVHPQASITAVVKANAYGHGAVPVSKAVLAAGANALAVAIPEEAIELRAAGITCPIYILGLTLPEQAQLYVDYDLTATVCELQHITTLAAVASKNNKCIPIMLKIDTGMRRIGIRPDEVLSFTAIILKEKCLQLQGLYTHLATADEQDKTKACQQYQSFSSALQRLAENGIKLPISSIANSAAIMDLPQTHFTNVRAGTILYGLDPSGEIQNMLPLKPIMQLKSRIVYLKDVPPNTAIGYGETYTTDSTCRIATIPIGYADGYKRLLSNKASVLIDGRRQPIVGRVCMDQIMVQLDPSTKAKVGDEVVLFGYQQKEHISVNELAQLAGTINYEFVCTISSRVPRVYNE